jgi:hypothetical protein
MTVRFRLERRRRALGRLLPLGQLDLVVAVPVGSGMADDLPPGVHFNGDGRVATVVSEGMVPDPSVKASLGGRLSASGLLVITPP